MPHAIEPIAPRGREAHWCQKYTWPEQPELRHCTVSQLPCATLWNQLWTPFIVAIASGQQVGTEKAAVVDATGAG